MCAKKITKKDVDELRKAKGLTDETFKAMPIRTAPSSLINNDNSSVKPDKKTTSSKKKDDKK